MPALNKRLGLFHFFKASHHQRRALVQVCRLEIEDAAMPVRRGTTGLLNDQGQRIGLI